MFVHHKFGSALRAAAVLAAAVIVSACGGGGDNGNSQGDADVRLVNATLTHANLALVVGSSTKAGPVAIDTASSYASIGSGSPTLQVNDTATGSAVATVSPSLSDGDHYALIAFESGGVVRTAIISEEVSQPSSGTANLRVFDAAVDAGALDVYVTPTGSPAATSPTYTFASSASVQESSFVSFAPGTYSVQVTGAGNPADLRLAIPSVTLASQGVATLVLTPTTGGTLVNAGLVAQRDTYTPARNTSARVRVAAAVTPGAVIAASVGSTPVAAGLVAPTIGAYTVVPADAAVSVSVNGSIVSATGTVAAGSDATLVVYGAASAATASIVVDDNRLPTATGTLKMRLFNGIVGTPTPLTLTADFAVVATSVAPGAASGYAVIPSSSATVRLDVTSSPPLSYNIPGNAVYTLFMLGDSSSPVPLLRRDR